MYHIAYAHQSRIGGGDARINADYARAGFGVQFTGAAVWGARIDHEIKGSNRGAYGFQTPLTDFYAFNGWALQYASTPPQGLRDTWLTARGQLEQVELFMEAHRFRTDFGGLARGREIDVSASYPVTRNLVVQLQHAHFRAGDGARVNNDVNKTWLALTYKH